MLFLGMPFLINALQGLIDFPKFRRKKGQVPTGIGSDLFSTMDTGVFLDVRSDFLGYAVVVAEDGAEQFLHGSRFLGFMAAPGWGEVF